MCERIHGSKEYVIDDVTNRRAVGTFLYGPYWTQTPKSLSF